MMKNLIATFLAAASSLTAHGVEWTPEAMLQTKMISDVQISPDNNSVLFVATEPKMGEKKGFLLSRIYKSKPNSNPVPLSSEEFSSVQPRWSPDGKHVAFLSTRDGARNLYLISEEGGKATALTQEKKDIQNFCWSPNGKQIAFVRGDENSHPINRLWLLELSTLESTPLTPDEYCVRGTGDFGIAGAEFDWSPDGKQIAFAHSPDTGFDSFHIDSSLATLDLETGAIHPLQNQSRYEAHPRYSPDGRSIGYISGNSPQKYSLTYHLAIRSIDTEQSRILSPTYNEGPNYASECFVGWDKKGTGLYFFEPKGTKYHLMLVPADGSPAVEIETGALFFKEPVLSPDRTLLGFVAQTPSTAPEAFIARLDQFTPIEVSNLNRTFLAYPQIRTDAISWTSPDGLDIEGLLTYPIDYTPGKQYPLLLVIHGGPMGFFDESFVGTPYPYPLAAFAQSGFLVLRPNPRGSCGYGKAFRCANYGDWGGADYLDILSGVDTLIAKGIADPEKMGVMGWSYGGYMTAWAITHTDRFKAASMGAGLCNLISFNGTTDLHRFLTDYLGEFPQNLALYQERSPINYVDRVTTPCLIQHGADDKRSPASQSQEFYHGLRRLGKEATLVLYPGMQHRPVDPNMHLDAMKTNLAWFQHHLRK